MATQLRGAIIVRRSSPIPVPELDLCRYELRVDGNPVRLEKIPMELLIFLVENGSLS